MRVKGWNRKDTITVAIWLVFVIAITPPVFPRLLKLALPRQPPVVEPTAPGAAPRVRKVRLAIVLCTFLDKAGEPRPPGFYQDYYTRLGTGGLADYWNEVTLGAVDLTDSEVFGWFPMTHRSTEVARLHFPGDRRILVQWGREAAAAHGIDLSQYVGLIVIQNWGVDHGDAGNASIVIVDQRPELLETTFIAHEMGHLLGLPHSFAEGMEACGRPGGEYCDRWDIMSAMNVFSYSETFRGVPGAAGPGLNVFASRALGALSGERLRSIRKPGADETLLLAPLNRPEDTPNLYAVEIRSLEPRDPMYTVEYRHKAGWDRGLPGDAVLVHEEKSGHSYLTRVLKATNRFATPRFGIEVLSIDSISERATVHVWTR